MTKTIKVLKDFTYYSLIKEAIYSTENMQATANEIFNYFVIRFPNLFQNHNSMTWKGNIRQVLSKNPEFVKLKKKGCTKEHFWTHRPIEVIKEEENRVVYMNQAAQTSKDKNSLSGVMEGMIDVNRYPNLLKFKRQNFEEKENTKNIPKNLIRDSLYIPRSEGMSRLYNAREQRDKISQDSDYNLACRGGEISNQYNINYNSKGHINENTNKSYKNQNIIQFNEHNFSATPLKDKNTNILSKPKVIQNDFKIHGNQDIEIKKECFQVDPGNFIHQGNHLVEFSKISKAMDIQLEDTINLSDVRSQKGLKDDEQDAVQKNFTSSSHRKLFQILSLSEDTLNTTKPGSELHSNGVKDQNELYWDFNEQMLYKKK